MSKVRVLLASVLKPINDTRMFEKFGQTLAKDASLEVHIVGFPVKSVKNANYPIHFHPFKIFKRLSFGRILSWVQFLRTLIQLQPKIVVVHTHELLLCAVIYRILSKSYLLYDIQENYYLNITQQNNFPSALKYPIGFIVRAIEKISSFFVDYFILAEQSYSEELPFIGDRYAVVENKYQPDDNFKISKSFPFQISESDEKINLLYSGTISSEYGIFEAINLTTQLFQRSPKFQLTIIGFSARNDTFHAVQKMISDKPYIRLIGGTEPVEHSLILDEIKKSDFGLLPYRPNRSTFRCNPTKMFEYMAYGLPMIIQKNPYWEGNISMNSAGLFIDFANPDIEKLFNAIQNTDFYIEGIPDDIFWKDEEPTLLAIIEEAKSNLL